MLRERKHAEMLINGLDTRWTTDNNSTNKNRHRHLQIEMFGNDISRHEVNGAAICSDFSRNERCTLRSF